MPQINVMQEEPGPVGVFLFVVDKEGMVRARSVVPPTAKEAEEQKLLLLRRIAEEDMASADSNEFELG